MANHQPVKGAIAIITAGFLFACVNTLIPKLTSVSAIDASVIALVQYLVAFIFLMPSMANMGFFQSLKTKHFGMHCFRVFLSAIGIQCWTMALAYLIPIWQGIALLMTSPLFVTIGSGLFLKEKVDTKRWIATFLGFVGAMIILEPWSENFEWVVLLPVAAAFFWACYSLMVKKLSNEDSPTTMVAYLFILITPFNLLIALTNLSPEGFSLPSFSDFGFLILLGFFTALAQLAVAKAYSLADASYIQPFDFIKLPLNVLAGWLVFNWVPPGKLWLGAAIIIGATMYITHAEAKQSQQK
ncbi:DMT family transporter [Glaesserella parasuis]|uniref:DMT family transporter n=1 Tax=Glaesserella parasuis TaxID=738 RepID=UPI0002C96210|nr:DMT family transporter [Glaesserella parasuis]EMY45802.1 transporter, drug/metabolite exporter family protein [Glaesserella parasuis gx033]MDG6267185.1 DMT family transporter [Glaesserella parasuis]MDG6324556.1 DMT family transporter [Glaesserella parasuis]MDG6363150.1 DMT family transporter [Glaesserella parasuis]MDG6456471.1 DMT family transporter [Glaesserella parasuis]